MYTLTSAYKCNYTFIHTGECAHIHVPHYKLTHTDMCTHRQAHSFSQIYSYIENIIIKYVYKFTHTHKHADICTCDHTLLWPREHAYLLKETAVLILRHSQLNKLMYSLPDMGTVV